MGERYGSSGDHVRKSRRWGWTTPACGAGTLLGVLLAVGALAGASVVPAGTHTFKAPFTGYAYPASYTSASVCGQANFTTTPSASAMTGGFGGAGEAKVASSGCIPASTGIGSSAYLAIDSYFYLSIGKPPKTGAQTVTLTTSLDWSSTISAHAGNSSQSADGEVEFEVYPYLIDQTNGSAFTASPSLWYTVNYTASGTYSRAGPTTLTFYWNGTKLNKANSYEVQVYLYLYAGASAYGSSSSSSAKASFGASKIKSITLN